MRYFINITYLFLFIVISMTVSSCVAPKKGDRWFSRSKPGKVMYGVAEKNKSFDFRNKEIAGDTLFYSIGSINIKNIIINGDNCLYSCTDVRLDTAVIKGDISGMNCKNIIADSILVIGNDAFNGIENSSFKNSVISGKNAFNRSINTSFKGEVTGDNAFDNSKLMSVYTKGDLKGKSLFTGAENIYVECREIQELDRPISGIIFADTIISFKPYRESNVIMIPDRKSLEELKIAANIMKFILLSADKNIDYSSYCALQFSNRLYIVAYNVNSKPVEENADDNISNIIEHDYMHGFTKINQYAEKKPQTDTNSLKGIMKNFLDELMR